MLYKSTLAARDGTIIPAFSDGKTMFSRYAPLREADNFATNLMKENNPYESMGSGGLLQGGAGFFVVCGLGNGLHIRALKKKFPTSVILVIEKSLEDIQWLKEHFDLSEILSQQDICITSLSQATERFIQLYNPLLQGNFFFLPLRSWVDQLPQEAMVVKNEIQQALKDIAADYSTQAYFGKIWFRNFFQNLSLLPQTHPPAQLPDAGSYSQAFVAAAGPSLENFIPDLQQATIRTDLYLIATDTSLPVLLRHNVEPNMVVTIDGQASSSRHFLKRIPGTTVLAADISCCPAVARRCHEAGCPVLFFRNRNPLPAVLDHYLQQHDSMGLPVIDTGAGTVTAAAVDLARWLGFTRIQVGGGDFAYLDGKPYCRGTYFEDQFVQFADRTSSMEQKYVELMFKGTTIRDTNKITTPVLENYSKSFHQYLQRHSDVAFILHEQRVSAMSPRTDKKTLCDLELQGEKNMVQQLPQELTRGFVEWYKELLLQQNEEVISSILPLYGWYIKKNKDKCDIFHIMKLAYSQTVRYTIRYGK